MSCAYETFIEIQLVGVGFSADFHRKPQIKMNETKKTIDKFITFLTIATQPKRISIYGFGVLIVVWINYVEFTVLVCARVGVCKCAHQNKNQR